MSIGKFCWELQMYSNDSVKADEYTKAYKFIELNNNKYGVGIYITTHRFRLFVGCLK